MSQLSNATLTTLQSTYFDDYDENKKYYRILFRPSVALQARELTQLQTILQKQIQRHGDHIFRDGSVVEGCAPTQFSSMPYIRVVDSFLTNPAGFDNVEDLNDTYLVTNARNSNTAVRAKIYTAKKGFQSNYPYTNRLYIQYVYSGRDGSNNEVSTFANGETLYIYSSNQAVLGTLSNTNIVASINAFTTNTTANAASGNGFVVGVSDGVIYQKGFFQKVDKQYVIVNELLPDANSAAVGFDTVETIVTENQDTSLNDNANGSSNFNAPGAHRLKLTPTLVSKSKTDYTTNKNFFPIIEFDGNTAVIAKSDPVYQRLGKEMDRRTYEESGDYVVVPHTIETTANTEDANVFNYEVSAGTSYVQGTRVQLIGTRRVQAYRANTTQIAQNQSLTANYGNYVFCKEVLGAMNFDKLGEVALYNSAFSAITDREGITGGTSGSVVGYANIKSVVWYTGTKGTADCQYYVYLFNIRMNPGLSFENDVKSLYATSGSTGYTTFKADIVLESSKAVLHDSTLTPMLFKSGFNAVKSLTPTGGSLDTTFYFRKTSTGTLYSNGFISVTHSGGLSTGGTEQLYDTNARDYQIVFSQNAYSANLTGTVTVNTAVANSTSANIVGSSTTFESSLKVGDTIRISNTAGSAINTFRVTAIYSNTLMTVTPNVSITNTNCNVQKYFQDGSILDVTDSMLSINAAANAFTISTGITITSGSGQTMYAQYPVSRTVAVPSQKSVKKNRLVKIDCSNNVNTSKGPWNLGLSDVIKINAIYVGTSYANTTANRVTWFNFDNGQQDDSYDHASISIRSGYKNEITGSTKILVDLDHLETSTSSGIGHYTVDSYPISNNGITANSVEITIADIPVYKSKSSSEVYDLRNTIDFRPIKTATANSVANTDPANGQITINPGAANTNTFNISVYGQYQPEVDSTFLADYEYYLPRYDMVLLNKDGLLSITAGVPDINPKIPLNISDGSVLADCFVPPFPSLTTREGESSSRKDMSTKINLRYNKRYTMRDIGVLEQRIKRLEYYTVLSTLEKAAQDLSIPDSTGRDRFKNGIFADPFNTHLLGNVTDTEYKISIDPKKSVARPYFKNHFIDFKYKDASSSNVTQKGPFITLPYDHEQFASQPFATKYRSCTESMWSWKGSLFIAPSQDIFTDEAAPTVVNNVQDNSAAGAAFENLQIYGSQSSSSTSSTSSATAAVAGGTETTATTTTQTTTTQQVTSFDVQYSSSTVNLGTYVTDVSIVPYMRSIDVAFYALHLKPNSVLHVFFDSVNVDEYVAPGVLSVDPKDFTWTSRERTIVTTTGPKGLTASNRLVANSSGGVAGIFTIPANKFRTGERKLLVTNVDDLVTGANAMLTKSEASFTSSGLAVSTQTETLTTINASVVPLTSNVTNTVVTSGSQTTFVPDPVAPPPAGGDEGIPFTGGDGGGGDGSGGSCFVAGTLVTMFDGSKKPIEDVVIGDKLKGETSINNVVGFDYDIIGGIATKRVPNVYGFNGMGRYVTAEHPLKTIDGWKSLSPSATLIKYPHLEYLNITELKVGDTLVTESDPIFIETIEVYENQNPNETVYNFVLDGDNTYYASGILAHNKDPIAQTFTVPTRESAPGQFITKVDLYFKQKDPNLGITVFLCETQNGYPDGSRVLGSAYLPSSSVTISDNGSSASTFEFLHPIYISSEKEYAFFVQPDADSPDYLIWAGETGGFDVITQAQVSKNPYDGVMFVSSNKNAWTTIQLEDLKFKLYRAKFTSLSGTAVFENEDDEYLTITGVVKANTRSIEVGDVVYSSNSTVANTATGAPFGIVQYYNEEAGQLILDSTVAGFSNTAGSERIQIHRVQPVSNTSLSYSNTLNDTIIAYANVASVDNSLYHTVTPKYSVIAPLGTNIALGLRGTDTSYVTDSNYINIQNEGMNEFFDKERIVMSRSNEKAFTSNNKSSFFKATLFSDNQYISPAIDLRRKSSYFIENIINDDTTNEEFTYGNALSKYVSKKVILADGQDAEDLSVYVTATRPINSDIKVYAKIQASDDTEPFDTKLWTELEYKNDGGAVYTATSKTDDFVEYEFGFASIPATIENFNANTGVNSAGDYITFTTNSFANNQLVLYYTAVGNNVVSGLANNTFYYVVAANSTALSLSSTEGGSALPINAISNSEIGHYLKGYIPSVAGTAFLNDDNSGIVEYYNNKRSRKTSFKTFAIKIVLTSTNRVNYPKLNDLRAIALQK